MSATEPPSFQEAARCVVCNCSFNTFRRRHHCRSCGRTLCNEHSSNQMALPQFGIYSSVRVCADCFNNSRSGNGLRQASSGGVSSITDTISKIDIDANDDPKTIPTAGSTLALGIKECMCGMPLCICESEAPTPSSSAQPRQISSPAITSESNPKPKKADTAPKNRSSSSSSKFSSAFGHVTNGTSERSQTDYGANGEGVDANYRDKQGLSLLHLAAVFNQTDIVFILMDSGASLEYKNAQGETPLDCAPATLQYKMRKKIEDGGTMNQSI
ncbi:hepatocyte growth factor-regulated tyrosine kinase substrate isoform X2 [Arachis ipaensis]|uniref:hepatocyte growth factor-regulated tyrosine kinase substrate isoform X2 n=1 Tax=Arachis ipaensis TaxID=130454 RepID=UPI000A2B1973|nr:hepatocyte growth factor-regulated tyrosine kinase substrate isoform X2 [Arachis ipaensis]